MSLRPNDQLSDALHDARLRLTEILQDHRSGMPRARVLAEVRELAGKLLALVIRGESPAGKA